MNLALELFIVSLVMIFGIVLVAEITSRLIEYFRRKQ